MSVSSDRHLQPPAWRLGFISLEQIPIMSTYLYGEPNSAAPATGREDKGTHQSFADAVVVALVPACESNLIDRFSRVKSSVLLCSMTLLFVQL